jgi:lysozyme
VQTIDPRLLADLKSAEGCELKAYRDSLGFWTVGFGHKLDQSIDWTGYEITQDTADGLLAQDVIDRTDQVHALPEWSALDTLARQNALLECVFNLGQGRWVNKFPATRASIGAGQWVSAATNLLNSPEWIAEVGRARVVRIAGYLQSGSYSLPLASALPP